MCVIILGPIVESSRKNPEHLTSLFGVVSGFKKQKVKIEVDISKACISESSDKGDETIIWRRVTGPNFIPPPPPTPENTLLGVGGVLEKGGGGINFLPRVASKKKHPHPKMPFGQTWGEGGGYRHSFGEECLNSAFCSSKA